MFKKLGLLTTTVLVAAAFQTCALAQAPELAPLPDGMVSIHYTRAAGDYDGWGAHIWESFEVTDGTKVTGPRKKSDVPLEGVTWGAPMKPTGKDGFGVYWQVKADEFRNQKVNIIIHRGDVKDQCGKDVSWFLGQGKRAFLKQGDCNVYLELDKVSK